MREEGEEDRERGVGGRGEEERERGDAGAREG